MNNGWRSMDPAIVPQDDLRLSYETFVRDSLLRTPSRFENDGQWHGEYHDGEIQLGWMAWQEALKRCAASTVAPEGWRPIESAPKDGTSILAWFSWFGGQCEVCSWADDKQGKPPRPYWSAISERTFGVRHARESQPKYWQPLPPPPECDGGK